VHLEVRRDFDERHGADRQTEGQREPDVTGCKEEVSGTLFRFVGYILPCDKLGG
jgi:hypothetical protein